MSKTTVVHLKKEPCDVRIDRWSIFGNPFTVREHGRERCLELFKEYFRQRIETDGQFRDDVVGLRGKVLGCWCKPAACHGDIIAEWLNAIVDNPPAGEIIDWKAIGRVIDGGDKAIFEVIEELAGALSTKHAIHAVFILGNELMDNNGVSRYLPLPDEMVANYTCTGCGCRIYNPANKPRLCLFCKTGEHIEKRSEA